VPSNFSPHFFLLNFRLLDMCKHHENSHAQVQLILSNSESRALVEKRSPSGHDKREEGDARGIKCIRRNSPAIYVIRYVVFQDGAQTRKDTHGKNNIADTHDPPSGSLSSNPPNKPCRTRSPRQCQFARETTQREKRAESTTLVPPKQTRRNNKRNNHHRHDS